MKTPDQYPGDENKHESTFTSIDGVVTVIDEEEVAKNPETKKEDEEADSSHYSVGGDNGW